MRFKLKANAAENYIEIDGTRFDIPNNSAQRDGMRELVVNHFCRVKGIPLLYPNATENASW